LLCVWLLWTERNNMLFNNIETYIEQLVEKAKYHSLWWLRLIMPRLCMVLIIGGRTLYIVWVSIDSCKFFV
jgi:hypothetical protein